MYLIVGMVGNDVKLYRHSLSRPSTRVLTVNIPFHKSNLAPHDFQMCDHPNSHLSTTDIASL